MLPHTSQVTHHQPSSCSCKRVFPFNNWPGLYRKCRQTFRDDNSHQQLNAGLDIKLALPATVFLKSVTTLLLAKQIRITSEKSPIDRYYKMLFPCRFQSFSTTCFGFLSAALLVRYRCVFKKKLLDRYINLTFTCDFVSIHFAVRVVGDG